MIINKKNISDKGFTLIETIVAIFVFSLILGATLLAIEMIYRTQGFAMQQAIAVNEARHGVEIMANEIRGARYADTGAYPVEKGAGKEFIFYSDVDNDGSAERVRYYLAAIQSGAQTKECYTTTRGGSCNVTFNNFLTGTLKSARIRVSTEGYYGQSSRFTGLFADGTKVADLCVSGCSQCAGAWQGTQTFDAAPYLADGSVQFLMDSEDNVKALCQWQNPNHAMKAIFDLSWVEEIPNSGNELRRGIIEPTGNPLTYPLDQEQSTIITSYVRNAPPIFTYYDGEGNQITDDPSILRDTKMMRIMMVINVDPNHAPGDYDLEQYVQIRNLKDE